MKKHTITIWSEAKTDDDKHYMFENSPLKNINYTFKSRFDEHLSSNPGELMAAAHAGSYSMKLTTDLTEAGYFAEILEIKCDIIVNSGIITKSELRVTANINDITEAAFHEIASNALQTCPISNALNLKIKLRATLKQSSELINRLMDNEFAYY